MRPRSYLYVPGDSRRKLEKAAQSDADALFIDLEDAVAPERKDEARALVRELVDTPGTFGDRQVWVRVGSGDDCAADIAIVAGASDLHGLVLAKTESVQDVIIADELLGAAGDTSTVLMPLLESAFSVLAAQEIAKGPRVDSLQLGEADLRADVGFTPDQDDTELLFARSMVVYASIAAALAAPVGPASVNFRDLDAFRQSCERVARLGFSGRACIHPAQLAVLHDVLRPTDEDIEQARRLVAQFDEAVGDGRGVMTDEDGQMVDLAVVRQARRVVEAADGARQRDGSVPSE